MIDHISIRNFAIIENTDVDLNDGLNVITGETGSGKSILIEAVSLALGSRADSSCVRTGTDKAVVELSGDLDGKDIVIRREVSRTGKNLIKVNGDDALLVGYDEDTVLQADAVCPKGEHTLSIRPESIRLSEKPSPSATDNIMPVTVVRSMFLGEKMRYFVQDRKGQEWIADIFDPGRKIYEGEVYMLFAADRTHVIEEDD